jgi:hypothetical protein
MEILQKIQRELKAPKSQVNSFGRYKYRSCEDILEAVKPLLGGAVLTLSDEIVLIGDRHYVKATATIWEGVAKETVTAYAREEADKKGMDAAQITGACSSYARKYALNGLFLIDDTKDADTMDNTKEKPSNKVETPKKATAEQKIEIRRMMVASQIEDRADQMEFYNFVMTQDTEEKAQAFIANFNEALKTYRKSKEV